ncbi:MAG: TM2 domain-containing protein [Thermoanaerobacterales bacterium]|nr:TM2 domain-containing protein [Bacillota bacterium]MDI6908057.1 TM2 domain-containing protein [Thermoanaerobacterales bacterium]
MAENSVIIQVEERKSTTVAYLLWFFLGGVGAHRFYLGKPGTALGMLALNLLGWLTLGIFVGFLFLAVFAIWWIVDAFLIPKMIGAASQAVPVVNVNLSQKIETQAKEQGMEE